MAGLGSAQRSPSYPRNLVRALKKRAGAHLCFTRYARAANPKRARM